MYARRTLPVRELVRVRDLRKVLLISDVKLHQFTSHKLLETAPRKLRGASTCQKGTL